jgi:hypothetical protein
MSHHYYYDHGPDTYNNLSQVGKILVMCFVFVPLIAFFVGMVVATFTPASVYLTAPVLCSNGTIQVHQVDKPSQAWGTSFTIYDYCVDSHSGKTSDLSNWANVVVGLIVAVVIAVVLVPFVILFLIIRFLRGRQSTS